MILDKLGGVLHSTSQSLRIAAELLFYSALWFGFIALLIKGRDAITDARRAFAETRFNLSLLLFDTVFIAPLLALAVALIRTTVTAFSLNLISDQVWTTLGRPATFVAVVF